MLDNIYHYFSPFPLIVNSLRKYGYPYFHESVRLTLSVCRYSRSAALITICYAARVSRDRECSRRSSFRTQAIMHPVEDMSVRLQVNICLLGMHKVKGNLPRLTALDEPWMNRTWRRKFAENQLELSIFERTHMMTSFGQSIYKSWKWFHILSQHPDVLELSGSLHVSSSKQWYHSAREDKRYIFRSATSPTFLTVNIRSQRNYEIYKNRNAYNPIRGWSISFPRNEPSVS